MAADHTDPAATGPLMNARPASHSAPGRGRGQPRQTTPTRPDHRNKRGRIVTLPGPCTVRSGKANGATGYRGVLGGCATTVPFTAVLTGPQRTTADNARASRPAPFSVLAGQHHPRSGFGSRGSLRPGYDRGRCLIGRTEPASGRIRRPSVDGNVIGRALASSACRST
jgi:hypothetical protein